MEIKVVKKRGKPLAKLVHTVPASLKALEEKKVVEKKGGELCYADSRKALLFAPSTPEEARLCGARLVRWMFQYGLDEAWLDIGGLKPELAVYLAQGIAIAEYKPEEFKSEKRPWRPKALYVLAKRDVRDAVKKGKVLGEAQNFARELDERPSNIVSPQKFAEYCQELAKKYGFRCEVWDEEKLMKKGMGGVLAVGRGSANPPRFVVLEYGPKNKKAIALVGKGVIFDTGGISLKPSRGMEEMKYDKTGACLILGVFKAVAELKLPVHLYAFLPLVENVPSGTATKPSDIIRMYNGKTVEVINTDAEGRLILADALSYASEHKDIEIIVDAATLTGAMIIALGRAGIGYFANNERVAKEVEEASKQCGERVWRFPLWPEYRKMLDSHVADIKNLGSDRGEAGSITAAMFLKEFVKKPWAHLDIAGVFTIPDHAYYPAGATGFGLTLLYSIVERFAKGRNR